MSDPRSAAPRIEHQPALDGLRGLALLGMLAYHAELPFARGGFLPLPTFFVLSGFLITSLLLAEWERSHRIGLRRFWARRLRRLMPASLLCLGAMSLYGFYFATPGQIARLQGDVLWALAYLANWRFVISDTAYTRLFDAPSPIQHFWSLAVEEQFYLTYPLAALWCLRRGGRTPLRNALLLVCAGSFAAGFALIATGASVDRAYYGTDSRAAELAVGCLLGVALHGRTLAPGTRRALERAGAPALAVLVALWTFVELEWRWIYQGGLLAYALLTALVIAASIQPGGPARRLLSSRVLCWLGRISYGTYVYHWPIFLILSAERTGLEPGPLLALRLLVTLPLAAASYELFEQPIRRGRALTGWRPRVATPVAIGLVAVAVTAVAQHRAGEHVELRAALEALQRVRAEAGHSGDPPTLHAERPRVAVYGDSTALALAQALGHTWREDGRARLRGGVAQMGCGLLREGRFRFRGGIRTRPEACGDRDALYAASVEKARPDLAVVSFGPWDVLDRQLEEGDRWRAPGDPVLDARLREEMLEVVDLLSRDGTLVVWLAAPAVRVRHRDGSLPPRPFPESDPNRMERFNQIVRGVEARRPDHVRLVDLGAHLRSRPGGELAVADRPDGIHFTPEAAAEIADEWLAEAVLAAYRKAAAEARAGS